MPPKKILQVVYQMNRGGVETWLMNVLRHIDRSRFHIDFLTHAEQPGDYDDEIRSLGSGIFYCGRIGNPIFHRLKMKAALRKLGPFDAVHSHDPHLDGAAMKFAHEFGVPIRIIHSHCSNWSKVLGGKVLHGALIRYSMHLAMRHACRGLACSRPAAEEYFGAHWEKDGRWQVLYCGEDFNLFGKQANPINVKQALGLPERALIIGHVGQFRKEKNYEFFIRVAKELLNLDDNFRFLIVGDGPLRPKVERLAAAEGVERCFVFTGSRGDVPRLMISAMDAFLFPSICEGLGLALVEAQAAGLPCVCSEEVPRDADIIPSLVTRISLASPPREWALEIMKVLAKKEKISKAEALSMAENSRFNLKRSIHEIERIYDA
ncbi:MAG: glycosyltransferase [Elusimicrobiota bacterium]